MHVLCILQVLCHLPVVGLTAVGKSSHGTVQLGQGWGEYTASTPLSYEKKMQTHTALKATHLH